MKLRDMIIKAMEEKEFTNITIGGEGESIGYGDSVFYPMEFIDPKGHKRTGRAYLDLDMGPEEEYSIFVENVGDSVFPEDEDWINEYGEPRVHMTL